MQPRTVTSPCKCRVDIESSRQARKMLTCIFSFLIYAMKTKFLIQHLGGVQTISAATWKVALREAREMGLRVEAIFEANTLKKCK